MPGIAQKISNTNSDIYDSDSKYQNPSVGNGMMPFNGSSGSKNGSWSKNHDDLSYIQLQKFWCELTPQDRHKLMRIDKQTLFEHARKNMYCSRCNGLLLEGFLQIVMHGKSLQQDAAGGHYSVRNINTQTDDNSCIENGCQHDAQDPSVHPWGGLTTARDGTLTLLDGYLCSKSLKELQNVFDSARARERERELLYPDACGGGGRGWISQGMAGYGRAHGNRETCALHTARLSVETLVDFWSALGEETRQSLLRMKEEDFIERLMYRFDSKRFCRDCRRNVIREFKELKELKRMRKDPRCTNWFCVADTAFQYEVSHDTVQADWHQTFPDASGAYHHFEWAIGTGEGKSDILEYENVGLSVRVQVNGLDLSGLNACYITLRAWKKDGRCSELCVKAHPLRGQQCVHCRLVVGDGFVSITRGESISRFFEHAEEAEEEEDDDSMDREGNELDGECSRPQKHAKSPELAREFLLDAATVIFKEQVEKAFREGTARQNAHSIFVCLALKLLEERVHVACKEIITLKKQTKLLEEEEKEKREEEERKERKRTKEREKKLRRKERLREKENKEKKCVQSNPDIIVPDASVEESIPCVDESANVDSISETGEATPASPLSSDIQDDQLLTEYNYSNMDNPSEDSHEEFGNMRDWNTSFSYEHCKYTRRNTKLHKDPQQDWNLKWPDRRKGAALLEDGAIFSKYEAKYHTNGFESTRSINGFSKQLRSNTAKSSVRNGNPRSGEKFQCPKNRISHRYGSHGCSCNNHSEYRSRPDSRITRVARESKCVNKLESPSDVSKPYYHGNMCTQVENAREINGRPKSKIIPNTKKVWEPLDPHKRYVRSNSDSDFTLRSTTKVEASESVQITKPSVKDISVLVPTNNEDNDNSTKSQVENCKDIVNAISQKYSQDMVSGVGELTLDSSKNSSSNSDNCSLCPSETSSNALNQELSSTSNSEESSQNSEGRETSPCLENGFTEQEGQSKITGEDVKIQGLEYASTISSSILPKEASTLHNNENGRPNICIGTQTQNVPPKMHNQNIHYPVLQAPTMGYYHQTPIPWAAGPPNSYPYFPNTYRYGFNGNARFMQYGTLQHMGPPVLNSACNIPVFQPVAQVNGVKQKEQTKGPALGGLNEVQLNSQNVHAPTAVENDGKPDKTDTRNNGFSLFHFGGPVGLSTGFKADTFPLKEGIVAGDNRPNNKKDFIEEYNLFAASNGIQFSFL